MLAGGSPGLGTPWRVPFRVRKLRPVPSRPSQPLLCLPGSVTAQTPVLSKVTFSPQCLKAGGTSARRPVTPSSLTAQGRWR